MVDFSHVTIPGNGKLYARFETSLGDMTAELYEDIVPNTVKNFVGLATGQIEFMDEELGKPNTRPFYDGLTFHRVIPDFMIQCGCPRGTGTGGPGYQFRDSRRNSVTMRQVSFRWQMQAPTPMVRSSSSPKSQRPTSTIAIPSSAKSSKGSMSSKRLLALNATIAINPSNPSS